ncbi:MAG: transporter substrate-binding domain-containing protein [Leptospirales bacterium]|nr:transporter substrate-binding domain-containing protein [Leptospirales bacterium]
MHRAIVCLCLVLASCIDLYENISSVDIADIKKRGKLLALTSYGPNSYFLYKGQALGYEYELLSKLAEDIGVKLEIVVVRNADEITYMLNSGAGDIVAANIAVTKKRAQTVQFTEHLTLTRQVLVQRARGFRPRPDSKEWIPTRNTVDLIGQKVHVREGSSYYLRLKNLSEEIGGDIDIVTVPGTEITEDLIKKVSTGEIDFTVADENTALINQAYYPGIDVETAISFPQRIAWIVRNRSPELLSTVNAWIRKMKTTDSYALIYNRYYRDPRLYRERVASEFFSTSGGRVSPFDAVFKKASQQYKLDWTLLAAVAYQESRFDPNARSWSGAQGVMQLMQPTAVEFGAPNAFKPDDNIMAGSKYLVYLDERWKKDITDPDERLRFVLASYNAGMAHVDDARRLASKYGKDQNKWADNVEVFILALSKPEFFNDPVVQYGYLRGEEPYNYVRQILERQEHYKKFVK